MIKLSIILPFYNVENYIAACLESLYTQFAPLDSFEVVCIDDCSPDKSVQIVSEYQKNYDNLVLVVHEHNKGLGAARNTGVITARGKYIWFVDSDDVVSADSISKLISIISTNHPDIVLFNYLKISEAGKILDNGIVFENSTLLSGKEFVETYFRDSFIYHLGYVWRCVYRVDYLKENNYFFPEKVFWEDTVFFPKTILYAERVISVKDTFYNYRVNENSISGKKNVQKADRYFQFSFDAGKELYDFAKEYMAVDPNLASAFRNKAIWYFNSFTRSFVFSSCKEKQKFQKFVKERKHQIKEISTNITWYNKILMNSRFGFILSFFIQIAYAIKTKLK